MHGPAKIPTECPLASTLRAAFAKMNSKARLTAGHSEDTLSGLAELSEGAHHSRRKGRGCQNDAKGSLFQKAGSH